MGKIISIILIALTLSSCAVAKKSKTQTTRETTTTEVQKDSSASIRVNEEISDAIRTSVVDSGDDEVNAKVDEILMRLNTQKSSGDNSYRFWYDQQLRELRAEFIVGQTKDSIVTTNTDTSVEKTFEEQIDEYIKKIVVPWWMYVIAFFLLLPQIKRILSIFINPTSQIYKTLKLDK
jgi:hypothetical protein